MGTFFCWNVRVVQSHHTALKQLPTCHMAQALNLKNHTTRIKLQYPVHRWHPWVFRLHQYSVMSGTDRIRRSNGTDQRIPNFRGYRESEDPKIQIGTLGSADSTGTWHRQALIESEDPRVPTEGHRFPEVPIESEDT